MLKLVTCDVSQIMDFFMQTKDAKENLFVFFHTEIPMEDHEALFQDYLITLDDFFKRYCHDCFEITDTSYESYTNEIQIRYRLRHR